MTYNPRQSVNMSDFINNLNVVHPEQETATDLTNFNFENDLFLNNNPNQWFDFDQGTNADLQPTPFDFKAGATTAVLAPDSSNIDILGDFDFQDFGTFPPPAVACQVAPAAIQAAQPTYSSPQNGLTASPQTGEKRKASESVETPFPTHFESEDARMAAEEDKRRRNTAASARFRVKKKQREQALEKSAKEMADKMSALEQKVSQLERENKWLKSLVIEKKDTKSAEEIAVMYQKFKEENDSKGAARLDGVGTAKVEA